MKLAIFIILGLLIVGGVFTLYRGYEARLAADEAQIQQMSNYLNYSVALGVFPSGAQLNQLAEQKANVPQAAPTSTKK